MTSCTAVGSTALAPIAAFVERQRNKNLSYEPPSYMNLKCRISIPETLDLVQNANCLLSPGPL
eukprot:scaffold7340_cov128-Cylindrotheca_fusiformis.AAC.4